mmetsp:Transcript_51474/g.112835  ORF Transcript_51474/g.112835 Transcript_51474/m.112835 type:complete len:316 (-) Transcript_51474:236-1183(-)
MSLPHCLHFLDVDTKLLGQIRSGVILPHNSTPLIVLAMPMNFRGCQAVQAQSEWCLVLPHFTSDIVATTKLVGKSVSFVVDQQTTDTAEGLSGKKFDLGVLLPNLDKPSRVHLHPLQVQGSRTNSLTHLDTVASAVLTVGGRQVHQVRAVFGQQRIRREIRTKTAGSKNHRSKSLDYICTFLVLAANDSAVVCDQINDLRLVDDAGHPTASVFLDSLHHLDESIGNGHARKPLLSAVRARSRMPTEPRHKRQIKVKRLHQPVHRGTTFPNQDFRDLRLLGTTLKCVAQKQFVGVVDPLVLLGLGARPIDATGGLR